MSQWDVLTRIKNLILDSYDTISKAFISVDWLHSNIHKGKNFAGEHEFGVILKSGGTAEVLLQNPADNYAHLYLHDFNPDAKPGQVEIFEGATFSTEGTIKNVKNLNRVSTTTNNMVMSVNPTLTADGTRLDIITMTASKASSDRSVGYLEWVLKPDTNYLIRFTNNSTADTTTCLAKMSWYEN